MDIKGERVELLVEICNQIAAECYLSPIGSRGYIEENNLFKERGIELFYQNFTHPRYTQAYSGFLLYMSILDLLFNEGNASLEIIRSGRG